MREPSCVSTPRLEWPWAHALPQVHLASATFDAERFDAQAPLYYQLEEPEAVKRAVAKRRCEFLAGRLCARAALQAAGGPAFFPSRREDRAPSWPAGYVGAISHTLGWAAALAAPATHWAGLGLDAERHLDAERARRLAGEILTEAERQRFAGEDPAFLVTLTFSLKESLFKALYPLVGQRFYFADAQLLDFQRDGRARLALCCDLSERWCHGAAVDGLFVSQAQRLLTLVAIPA